MAEENKVQHSYDESDIQVLEGLEAVRKRPGMYIGTTSSRGLHHLVWEIVDNSIDEALAGYASHIKVILKDQYLEIINDGEPIDNSNPESLFQPYEIGHKGQFGLGLSIVYKTVTMYGFKVEALNKEDGVSFVIHK